MLSSGKLVPFIQLLCMKNMYIYFVKKYTLMTPAHLVFALLWSLIPMSSLVSALFHLPARDLLYYNYYHVFWSSALTTMTCI